MRIAVKDHYRETVRYIQALEEAGHEIVTMGGLADALLIDLDTPILNYREMIDYYADSGAAILQYPHGAGPMLGYDGLWEPYDRVDANLVHAPGYAELLRRIDYPVPTHTIGWSYCELAPFRPCAHVRRVLFAPTHPNAYGDLTERSRASNAETFERLLHGPWELTVRHLGTIEENALWQAEGVTFVSGQPDLGHAEIDAADVVVAAEGTFPCLSVARGAPTVMCAQGHPPIFGLQGETPISLRRPELYLDYLRYPIDIADGPVVDVLHRAARSAEPIRDWKRRFVGEALDGAAFAALVERLALRGRAAVAVDRTRGYTVTAFADEVCERPELLAAYAERFGPDDDATLILWGPAMDDATLLGAVGSAIEAAGLDPDTLPDVLLLPLAGSPEADRYLASRSDAVLSEWPAAGRLGDLPRLGLGCGTQSVTVRPPAPRSALRA